MPRYEHENFGDVQDHLFMKGTITSVDVGHDLADVTVPGGRDGTDIPLFYHCDPDSEERDNGAIYGAATGFKEDDEVIVMCEVDGKPVRIVGFVDGIKACSNHFFVIEGGYNNKNILIWDIGNNTPAKIFRGDGKKTPITYPCDRMDPDVRRWFDDGSEDTTSEWIELFEVVSRGFSVDRLPPLWTVTQQFSHDHGMCSEVKAASEGGSPFGSDHVSEEWTRYRESGVDCNGPTTTFFYNKKEHSDTVEHSGLLLMAQNGSDEEVGHFVVRRDVDEWEFKVTQKIHKPNADNYKGATTTWQGRDLAKRDISATVKKSPYFPHLAGSVHEMNDALDFEGERTKGYGPDSLKSALTPGGPFHMNVYWPYGCGWPPSSDYYAYYGSPPDPGLIQASQVIRSYGHTYAWWYPWSRAYETWENTYDLLTLERFYAAECIDVDTRQPIEGQPPLEADVGTSGIVRPPKNSIHDPNAPPPVPLFQRDDLSFLAFYHEETRAMVQLFMRRKVEDDPPKWYEAEYECYATCDSNLDDVAAAPTGMPKQDDLVGWVELLMNDADIADHPTAIDGMYFRKSK